MTQAEKLQALIQKAIDNGWTEETGDEYQVITRKYDVNHKEEIVGTLFIRSISAQSYNSYLHTPEQIIFNQDFARALWGTKDEVVLPELSQIGGTFTHVLGIDNYAPEEAWQWHIQQMVIAPDPIDYAYEAVFGNNTV